MSEVDPFGIPIPPEPIDMDNDHLGERRAKGMATARIEADILARDGLTPEQKDELISQALTSMEDTMALIRSGLLVKILHHMEDGIVPEFGPPFGEGVMVGVHWFTDKYTSRVYPSIHGYQMIDGEYHGFDGLVWKNDKYGFTPDDLEVLATLADAKEYDI